MATTPVASSGSTQDTSSALNSSLGSLNLDDFLKMLLTELQNQDPLSPMDSSQMLTQIGQISQVGATQSLTSTLNSVLLGQTIGNATAMIGKTITGLGDDGTDVTGKVDKVTISDGQPVLTIGSDTVQLKNVKSVLPDNPTDAATTASTTGAVPVSAPAGGTTDSTAQLQQLLQQLQSGQAQPVAATG
jgi:flagellar basal-body rod modification protein FlgD